jgi:F-type H+-transporting ATPase subunit delta
MKLEASQYAKLVVSLGMTEKEFTLFQKHLWAFFHLLRSERKLRSYLLDPTLLSSEKERWLAEISSRELARFLLLVVKNGDVEKLKTIIKRIEEARDGEAGVARVVVTSATPLSDATSKKLEEKIAKKYDRKLVVEYKVDPSVLGGIRIQHKDEVIDDTVEAKINSLRENLILKLT